MILRCLPPEVLAGDISEFEASGAAATEIGLPMNMILGQLPSGKVEIPLQELVAHFPPGFLQPTDSLVTYFTKMISLPLMDVVMRIPPDLLALRPDQKDVDSSVINMADPFTEEILREQAEAARRASEPKIIEESQAPQEEFVPQEKAVAAPKRPAAEPLVLRPSKTSMAPMPSPTKPSPIKLGMPAPINPALTAKTASLPTPLPGSPLRPAIPVPNSGPTTSTMTASGRIPLPTRPTSPIPTRPAGQATHQIAPSQTAVPVPPIPRHTGSIPAPPAPRHTTALPNPRQYPLSTLAPNTSAATPAPAAPAPPVATTPSAAPEAPAPSTPPPSGQGDDLQRLAALAMEQLGDSTETGPVAAPTPAEEEAVAATEPEAAAEPAPEAEPEPETTPEPVAEAEPEPEAEPVAAEPEPEPVRTAETPEPIRAPEPIVETPAPAIAAAPAATPEADPTDAPVSAGSVAFNLNTCSAEDLVLHIPGCSDELAHSIVEHRAKIGSFKHLEDLLDVPGITKAAYTNLTGEAPPENRIPLSLGELLGFPPDQNIALKDVTDRIACWPDVTGCVLGQGNGLSLVGTVPEGLDKAAIVAFAPRMFDAVNKSFEEISGKETDALIIPSPGTSFHIFRSKELFLIILSRLPQMPERHMKVARFVVSALSIRTE